MMLEGDRELDELILIDGHSGAMCACNTAAGILLNHLREGASCEDLAAVLSDQFGLLAETAKRDVRDFLDGLSALAAIEVTDVQDISGERASAGFLASVVATSAKPSTA
jgi:hypothetical protein